MRRIKWGNLIRLIVIGSCAVLLLHDYTTIIASIFNGESLGLTAFGVQVDVTAMFIMKILIDEIMEED